MFSCGARGGTFAARLLSLVLLVFFHQPCFGGRPVRVCAVDCRGHVCNDLVYPQRKCCFVQSMTMGCADVTTRSQPRPLCVPTCVACDPLLLAAPLRFALRSTSTAFAVQLSDWMGKPRPDDTSSQRKRMRVTSMWCGVQRLWSTCVEDMKLR